MSFLETLEDIAKGAATGIVVITALPVFGTVGTITAAGVVVGSTMGVTAVLADKMRDED